MSVLGAHDNGVPAGGSCCRAFLLRPILVNPGQEQKTMNIVRFPRLKVLASSFSERHAAIDSELLYYGLRRFSDTDRGNDPFLYRDRKFIAMDGVNFDTALNKDAPSFMSAKVSTKSTRNLHPSSFVLFDYCVA